MIYLILPLLIAVGVAISALALHITTRILKVDGANYKTAFVISVLQLIFSLIAGMILGVILSVFGIENLSWIFAIPIAVIILHKLLKKYYQTDIKKNMAIYAVSTVIVIVALLATTIPIRSFVFMPFYVRGLAMEPAYENGDYLIINEINKDYRRGDVVVFRHPKRPKQFYIKRIIGLPGEKVRIKDGFVFLYDKQNPDGYKLSEPYLRPGTRTSGRNNGNIIPLAGDEYYVLGDNRKASIDSRSFGVVKYDSIVGKVWLRVGKK